MTNDLLNQRLNKILPKIMSSGFLNGKGIGNEIPFYIFDYPPEHELQVRSYINTLTQIELKQKLPDCNVVVVNLLKFLLDYIEYRGYTEKFLRIASLPDNAKTLKSIKSIAGTGKLAGYFIETIMSRRPELILISGVGSVYPVIRVHELLNNLHRYTGLTPLILFYPGVYDKTALRLFGQTDWVLDSPTKERNYLNKYYRAFRLID
ncbi:MAG: DUF1788 domain-containing protein [Planctomycetaceae bacterium]|jgi:hypothetical protein|nr:DUF1788 domain-containing protein [Planctomycetaceae bacterium]